MRSVRDKRRDLWENNAWVLHHDNAAAHSALSTRQFLAERNVPNLEHPPYSSVLAPFFLFPKLKGVINWTRFPDVEAIKRAVTMELWRIPEEAFRGASKCGRRGWKSV